MTIKPYTGNSLSDLYGPDLQNKPHAFLLPYPNTHPNETFPNDKQYVIQDGSTQKIDQNTVHIKEPWRHLATLGDGIPGIVTAMPPQELIDLWKDQFALQYNILHLPHASYCNDINASGKKILSLFPYQHIDKQKHAVDPDKHYAVLNKQALSQMNIPTPAKQVLSTDPWSQFAAEAQQLFNHKHKMVLKMTHSLSGDGTFIVQSQKQLETALTKIAIYSATQPQVVLVEEFIDIAKNNILSFYVDKLGEITFLGNGVQDTNAQGQYLGGSVEYDAFDQQKFQDIMINTAAYLHAHDYFGYASLDILEDKNGALFVIDGNFRLIGSAPLYILQHHLQKAGIGIVSFSTEHQYTGGLQTFIQDFAKELHEKTFLVLSALENKGTLDIYGITTGADKKHLATNTAHMQSKGLSY